MTAPDWLEYAARAFDINPPLARGQRQWPTPGAMAKALDPGTRQTPTLDLIDGALVDVLNGHTKKLILGTSPQVGKSQRVSRRFPLYALKAAPELRIALVSATLPLAEKWGRTIRQDIAEHPELGIVLRKDSNSAKRWETQHGGSLFCTSWSSGTVGQPIDLLIIDDPITSRADAESAIVRERIWEFWENDAATRARATIVMATRWHVSDLSGQLVEKEPGQWRTLYIPAISEGEGDPLGRQAGVELESANPELHPPGFFIEKKKTTSPYVWSSVYQQSPTGAQGGIFKRGDWRHWHPFDTEGRQMLRLEDDTFELTDCARFITMDLATSTRTSADYTVAAAWAITLNGDLVLLDRLRDRVPEIDHAAFIAPMRQRWLGRYDVTHVESRMFGTTLIYALGRAGVPVSELKANVDKLTRALPAAGLVRQHRVWLPHDAPWIDEWLDEHADFPNVSHDDQVDCMAYAAQVAIEHWVAPETAEQTEAALRAAEPEPGYVDLMTARF